MNKGDKVIVSFNRGSNTGEPVSFHDDKIVLISRDSEVKDPELGVPYICEVDIYDTNPQNPVKGSRVVKVLNIFEVKEIEISKDADGVHIKLITDLGNEECVIGPGTFDPRTEIRKAMKRLGCRLDFIKIDSILNHVQEKLG